MPNLDYIGVDWSDFARSGNRSIVWGIVRGFQDAGNSYTVICHDPVPLTV